MGDAWFFDRFAPFYDRLMPAADRSVIEAGLRLADGDVTRVVDLAGGSGRVARRLQADYDVAVFDLSRPMLRQARRHGLAAVQADATRLPVPTDALDGVVVADAYHHLPDPAAVLDEVERVLRPGGVIVVQDFDPRTVRGWAIEIVERILGWPATFRTPGALTSDLEAAGFATQVVADGFEYTVVGVAPEPGT